MTLRALVAPQQFKGTLTARQAAEAIARGVRSALPDAELDLAPLADGGQGTVDALVLGRPDGEHRTLSTRGPLGAPVQAHWGYLPQPNGPHAVIEMAAASGLTLMPVGQRAVLDAHTFGTGELIRAALDAGCRRISVGAGDSATCDGGMGAAAALGVRFLDGKGAPLPLGPRHLPRLERIDASGLDARLRDCVLEVLADVRNPLLGEEGAARVYGPQKGADPDDVEFLETALQHLVLSAGRQLGTQAHAEPGSGAGGGLGYGLSALCGARIRPGFDVISEAMQLFSRVAEVDFVLTGEGRIDVQTTYAKGPWSLGRLARMQHKRVVAFAGAVSERAGALREAFDEVLQVTPSTTLPSPAEAGKLLQESAWAWADGQRRRRGTGENKKLVR